MGFNVVPLAQKARTKTLIVDSDLNLGNYDLITTDAKGDTAEFSEFVGGVGNFSNVIGSGNLDIEGTGNIKGLTTFQNAVQVNGSLHVEGSINNVNIDDNGEITTAQGVNADSFNGVELSGVVNVTPSGTWFANRVSNLSTASPVFTTILPLSPIYKYTGSIIFRTPINSTAISARVIIINDDYTVTTVNANTNQSDTTANLTNARGAYYHCGETVAGNIFKVPVLSLNI